jgi:hypothetical protein
MPVHSAASLLTHTSIGSIIGVSTGVAALVGLKAWSGGRKCTWERDWAGKMILIIVSCESCCSLTRHTSRRRLRTSSRLDDHPRKVFLRPAFVLIKSSYVDIPLTPGRTYTYPPHLDRPPSQSAQTTSNPISASIYITSATRATHHPAYDPLDNHKPVGPASL